MSDRSRVDVLEDCLVEKSFSDLTWDRSLGLEGRKILCDDTQSLSEMRYLFSMWFKATQFLLWLNLCHGLLFQCPVVRIYFQLWKVMYSLHVRSNLLIFQMYYCIQCNRIDLVSCSWSPRCRESNSVSTQGKVMLSLHVCIKSV